MKIDVIKVIKVVGVLCSAAGVVLSAVSTNADNKKMIEKAVDNYMKNQ